MEATTARDEHGVFLAKTIQSFEFENYSFLDPYDTIGKVTEWCENYLRSKQEPVVNVTEKVIRPHHCECCGAPMPKGTTKCEYCGTEYY